MSWTGGGTTEYDLMVWRHSCFSLSRSSGKFKLFENGQKVAEKVSVSIKESLEKLSRKPSLFTLGCYYRNSGYQFMSMYGSVTDAQMFSRELTDKEMTDVTSCKSFLNGDIIQWDRESWQLKSPFQTSKEEVLDLEKDVCKSYDHGFLMVPHKQSFTESLHVCETLSGSLLT